MKTINVEITQGITIGRQGENNVEVFNVDITPWVEEFGVGTLDLLIQRPLDKTPYLLGTERIDDNTYQFIIRSTEVQNVGTGKIQFRYLVDDKIKKSAICALYVLASLENETVPPIEWESYIDHIIDLENKAIEFSKRKPIIKDGNWWVYNALTNDYEDTGVKAEGTDGIDGKDGRDGIDGKDGADGYTPIKGVDYRDGIDGKDGINGKDGLNGKDGAKGEKGDKGDKGNDALGFFVFTVENGHLLLTYTGDDTPDIKLAENGHLYLTL